MSLKNGFARVNRETPITALGFPSVAVSAFGGAAVVLSAVLPGPAAGGGVSRLQPAIPANIAPAIRPNNPLLLNMKSLLCVRLLSNVVRFRGGCFLLRFQAYVKSCRAFALLKEKECILPGVRYPAFRSRSNRLNRH